ncbi:MAG: hypothetical protein V1879_08245 [Pseudomonadota bacterium]
MKKRTVEIALHKRLRARTYKGNLKIIAMALPKEKRQECLDLLRTGLRLDEVGKACGISVDEVMGVFLINIKTIKTLNRVTI